MSDDLTIGVIAGGNKYSDLDASMSATGRRFSQLCMEDEKCASLVGPDPYGAMEDFFENLNTQPCIQQFGGLVTPRILRENFFQLLKNPISRPAVFPILYRIRRCSEDDLSRITQVVQKLFFGSPVAPPSAPYLTSIEYSSVLNNHISVSEMWADNNSSALSRQQIEERVASTPFGGYRKFELSTLYPTWPRYSLDDYHGKYANTTVPVLLLAAELDVDAPINWAEQAASQGFNKPNQRLIKIPYGSHNTLLNTPVTNSDKTCGFQLIKQFIDSGATSGMYSPVSINTECTTKVEVVDFAGTTTAVRDYATEFVGSPDIWGVGAPVQEPTNAAVQTTSTYYFFLLSVVAVLVLYLIN
jgi:pimeloyl-ACP methyl ester carboxylesterase